jgi:undecaprenyl-diphosphatase
MDSEYQSTGRRAWQGHVPAGDHTSRARRRADWYALGGGLAVTTAAAVAAAGSVPSWEIGVFRAVNDLAHEPQWVLWPLQQSGMALAVPVGALLLWRLSSSWWPPVILLAAASVLGWGAANVVRELVGRPRPGSLLAHVQLGYDVPTAGAAFPSGHMIVVVMLATVLAPYLSSRLACSLAALALGVALARMYVGAHLPLELLGGAALGVVAGSIVNLVAGISAPHHAEMRRGRDG